MHSLADHYLGSVRPWSFDRSSSRVVAAAGADSGPRCGTPEPSGERGRRIEEGMFDQVLLYKLPAAIARAKNLPCPSPIATEILHLAGRDDATVEGLAQLVSRDPALSAQILNLANSAFYRRGAEIASLESAATSLGMNTLRLMALGFSLTGSIPRAGKPGGLDYGTFWRRTLTLAVAGRSLSRLLKDPGGDEAFLCGLLGRLGQSIMAEFIATEYASVIAAAKGTLPTAALERERLGFDFHQAGAALLRDWSLPEPIFATVRWYGDPDGPLEVSDVARRLIPILNLADLVTEVVCGWDEGRALYRAHEVAASRFGIVEEELEQCIFSMEQGVADAAAVVGVEFSAGSYERILKRARARLVPIGASTSIELERAVARAEEIEGEDEARDCSPETDRLTGLPDRSYFDRVLQGVVDARLKAQSGRAFGLIVLAVDQQQRLNERYGHAVGDEVLRRVATALRESIRATDLAARYDGEEFVAILPNTTAEELHSVAERLRRRVAEGLLEHDGELVSATVSVGGACVRRLRDPDDGRVLLALADACLYRAKGTGRNRTVCAEFETVEGED